MLPTREETEYQRGFEDACKLYGTVEFQVDTKDTDFRRELSSLVNRFSKENGSNTPDFILADYIADALTTFDRATRARDDWAGIKDIDPKTIVA